jgi:hypothetical protein
VDWPAVKATGRVIELDWPDGTTPQAAAVHAATGPTATRR